jgi:predicted phage baseplate assembly protein
LPINYTLYKVAADGDIDTANANGDIRIYESEKESNTVLSNLVLLEGSLAIDQGTFADTEALKSITLQQSPVVEGSVQAFITGLGSSGAYRQVDNIFYASGADDKVFQVLTDDAYGAVVVFGDNNIGKVPAVGDQYTITYRVGGGTRGNIIKGLVNSQITVSYKDATNYPATVENTSQGTGGADAETIEHVKRYGPLMFRTQNRLVTLTDYKAFANSYMSSYGSVGKATAVTRRAYSSANIIDIYVLERASNTQLRKATPEYKRQLVQAMEDRKMLTDEIVVVDGLIRTLDLQISLRLDKKYEYSESTIKAEVRDKILNFFNTDNTDFGKAFNPQDLMYSIFEVEQVRFATIDNVPDTIQVNFNEIVQLNNFTLNVYYV